MNPKDLEDRYELPVYPRRDTVLVSSYLQSTKRIYRPEYREDGYMDDYRTECPPSVTPLAECFIFLRDMAVGEVRCGAGGFLLSQLEIHRHLADDPVALRFFANLLASIKSKNTV